MVGYSFKTLLSRLQLIVRIFDLMLQPLKILRILVNNSVDKLAFLEMLASQGINPDELSNPAGKEDLFLD